VNIVIRADANHTIGVGHFIRCMTLARQLKSAGHTIEFQSLCEIPQLVKSAQDNGIHLVQLNLDTPDHDTNLIESNSHHDWAIVDGYHLTEKSHESARLVADRLLVIDDAPRNIPYTADLILDQNYGAEIQQYPLADSAQLLGTKYALIRPEIASLREYSLSRTRTSTKSLVITFGGSDPAGATGKMVTALKNAATETLQVAVIAGPANSQIPELTQLCETSGYDLRVNPPNLPEILANADLAISATGTTVWELMCLGVPVLSTSIADNQIPAALALERDGLIEYFGKSSELSQNSLSQLIADNLANSKNLAGMAIRASETIDGSGVARVVAAMSTIHSH
jgi:UDP-2,4-diacetamido-2,4,6-trideoxy-beta-L-altropyranose hydrolase